LLLPSTYYNHLFACLNNYNLADFKKSSNILTSKNLFTIEK
jgi:hypothetical protein